MKIKLTVLIILITFSLISTNELFLNSTGSSNPVPPAPVFVSISPNTLQNVFPMNQTITLTYQADRFQTNGLLLLGTGSNLTMTLTQATNFTKTSSLKDKTTYTVNFNITSYTTFYAWAWYGTLNNGTAEKFSNFDNTNFHQIWVQSSYSYPTFNTVDNASVVGSNLEYYAPLGKQVQIKYTNYDPYNNGSITLVMANNGTSLYNDSLNTKITMSKILFDSLTNITVFGYNYTITDRIVYFTAKNQYGYERSTADTSNGIYHMLQDGFTFNSTFAYDLNKFTNIDKITFNVTSYNETVNDQFYYKYRVFENISSTLPLVNWTTVAFGTNINTTIVSNSENYNTTVTTYQSTLINPITSGMTFDVGNKIDILSYDIYNHSMYNETTGIRTIVIKDVRPIIDVTTANFTLTNLDSANVTFSLSTVRGNIIKADLYSNYTTTKGIIGKTVQLVNFIGPNNKIINGIHVVNITVENDFNATRTVLLMIHVDTTPPKVIFLPDNIQSYNSTGRIRLDFNYTDSLPTDTGVKFAKLNWGDGIVINATGLNTADHYYHKSGTYTVLLTVYDKLGNVNSTSVSVVVNLPTITTSTTVNTPFNTLYSLFAFTFVVLVYNFKIKKRRYKKE